MLFFLLGVFKAYSRIAELVVRDIDLREIDSYPHSSSVARPAISGLILFSNLGLAFCLARAQISFCRVCLTSICEVVPCDERGDV
jgi:hypothetical protein